MSRSCRLFLTQFLLLLLAGCTLWPPQSPAWGSATGGEQIERLWWKAVKQKNWGELESHLAPTYVGIQAGERHDRSQELQRLRQLAISDYSLGDFSIQPNGQTLVVTYTISLRGSLAGQPFALTNARMMTAWQRQKHGWVAIAHAGP